MHKSFLTWGVQGRKIYQEVTARGGTELPPVPDVLCSEIVLGVKDGK